MRIFLVFIIAVFSFGSEILVAAAANTTYAMDDIVKTFYKECPGVKVKVVLASSGKLTAQIVHGAPYDIFMSANMKYPQFLYKKGFAKNKPAVYAKGALALFSLKKLKDMNDLLKVSSIAVANPKTAPYGKAAIEALKKMGIYEKVKNRLVFAESVSAVIPYTLNSADIGIVAKSSMFSEKMKKFKNFLTLNTKYYNPISQGIVLLNGKKEAKCFYNFILSNKARKIFEKYGYVY